MRRVLAFAGILFAITASIEVSGLPTGSRVRRLPIVKTR